MPIRQGGILASRASTWPRDHFCRSTMAPRASWPTTWNEFLPISMPITAFAALLTTLASGQADIVISDIYATKERAKAADFITYSKGFDGVLVAKGNPK